MQIAELEFQLDDKILTQRTLRIRIGSEDVRLFMDQASYVLQAQVLAPGFRRGKAPLSVIRKHFRGQVTANAFDKLFSAAMGQILAQLKPEDKPFIPPEVLDRKTIQLRYGDQLEFSVKYLIDPSNIGNRPGSQHDHFDPLDAVINSTSGGSRAGIPHGPLPPVIPQTATEWSGIPE